MSRWARRSLWAAAIVAIAALLWLVDMSGGYIACGQLPISVRGTVVDAATGAPVSGAALFSFVDPEEARDPAYMERRRDHARTYEALSREDWTRFRTTWGSGRSDASGAFEIIVGMGISESAGRLGIVWHRSRGSAFSVARALLVEKGGYATLVHETKGARWIEQPDGEIVGTLDVGTIRLKPEARR